MSVDRSITWRKPPEWGSPTLERLAQVARDFLGPRWEVRATSDDWLVCECPDPMTFPLTSEYPLNDEFSLALQKDYASRTRGFEVDHEQSVTRIITRRADEFTGNIANGYTKLIARWWHGDIEWPT